MFRNTENMGVYMCSHLVFALVSSKMLVQIAHHTTTTAAVVILAHTLTD